jgi:hypothetical protein
MSKSDLNVESVISRVETALRFRSNHLDSPSIDQLLAEIQSAMTQWPNAREMLGPLIGKLRAVKSSTAESPINWIPVLQGHLAIGHRPKIKIIKNLRSLGATHVLTLLSESEGAEDIGKEVQGAGIDWIWLPFPPPTRHPKIDVRESLRRLMSYAQRWTSTHAFTFIVPQGFTEPG